MPAIGLRAANDDDSEFLYSLYVATRADEVAAFGWDEQQQAAFLRMQFNARQAAYRMQFPGAEHNVVLVDDEAAGRMIVHRRPAEIVLVDIVISPEQRGKGVAGHLLRQLQDEAAAAGQPLVLRVEKTNAAAQRFYTKLGFTVTSENDLLFEMRWTAK